jgi:hypothetical protein
MKFYLIIERDLHVIFGEYRDRQAVQSFVQAVRTGGDGLT